jgi:hypothetical protein
MVFKLDKSRLEKALKTYKHDSTLNDRNGFFINFRANQMFYYSPEHKVPVIQENIRRIYSDFIQIDHLIDKISLLFDLFKEDRFTHTQWLMYVGSDIDTFHIKLRSIFDELAGIFKRLSDYPNALPKGNSFEKLLNWANKSGSERYLDPIFLRLLKNVEWFEDIRAFRNASVHNGADVFLEWNTDDMLFQIFGFERHYVQIPKLMFNKNTVRLDLYIGLVIGYLIAYLEDVFEAITTKYSLPVFGESRHIPYYPSKPIMYKWIELALFNLF